MGKIKDDLNVGLKAEKTVKPILEKLFGKLTKTKDPYDNFDFYSDKYMVEHKERFINFGQYDSLYLEKCKYEKFLILKEKNPQLRFFAVWTCRNGRYMWEINDDTTQFYDKYNMKVNRGTHTQSSNVICVRNEYISPFSDYERVVVKKSKKSKK